MFTTFLAGFILGAVAAAGVRYWYDHKRGGKAGGGPGEEKAGGGPGEEK